MGWRERVAMARAGDLTLGTLLERLADVHGTDHPLAEESGPGGLALTYGQAADRVAGWAGALGGRVEPGRAVLVDAPNGYGTFLLSLAVIRAGGVAVPVSSRLTPAEVAGIAADAGARERISGPESLEGAGPPPHAGPPPPSPGRTKDVAVLFYTSGTTGRPKGAQLTHRALLGLAGPVALCPRWLCRSGAVSGMPVAHIGGFSMLLLLAVAGIPVYLLDRFRPDAALDAIEGRRAALFVGVPTMYRMMMEAGAADRDLSSVRLWASGADAMPAGLARRFQALGAAVRVPGLGRTLGRAAFVDGYGMVELGGGVALKVSPPGPSLPVGGLLALPLPGYRLRVVDPAGAEVARGAVGELVVKGPGVMAGYQGEERATAEVMTAGGWLRTGDLATRRRLGLVELVGRHRDVIKSGGYSVFPAEVEDVLNAHPAVAEAAVVGLPCDRMGQVPAAAVNLRPPGAATEEGLVAWAGARLAGFKVPKRILFVDELPRTGNGKLQKARVRALFDQEGDRWDLAPARAAASPGPGGPQTGAREAGARGATA